FSMKACVLLLAVVPLASCQLLQALAGQAANFAGQQNQAQMQRNLNEVLANGKQVVEQSRIQGVTTRLCSCQEQQRCVENMQDQARQCGRECWGTYDRIASNPQAMYQCAEQNQDLLTGMVSCLTNLVDSCSNQPTDREIPKSNIAVMLSQIEGRLKQNKERILKDPTMSQMRDLVEVTMDYGLCVKQCFIQKNRQQGACFDHLGCQPFISGDAFQQASRRCTQAVQDELKSRATIMCDCATRAGIRSSQQSCTVLNVVSNVAQGGGVIGGLARGGLLSALGGK
ncbi:hypothetical protein PFISCL1PPCAC_8161, partial [Pristionchus fissidentatus]